MTHSLSPDEDAVLRRLHWFERFGAELAPPLKVVKSTIRSRDKRGQVREPDDRSSITTPATKPVS